MFKAKTDGILLLLFARGDRQCVVAYSSEKARRKAKSLPVISQNNPIATTGTFLCNEPDG
jgi:hypothetical protein